MRDCRAFRELVERYLGDIFTFLYRSMHNEEKAQKTIRSLFVNIWCCPYLYSKKFKLSLYSAAIRKIVRWKINVWRQNSERTILEKFSKKEILAINLYYFSTLRENEIEELNAGIKETIGKVNSNLTKIYGINLDDFMASLSGKGVSTFELKKDIINIPHKYEQRDKYQTIILVISVALLTLLLIVVIYSAINAQKSINKQKNAIEVMRYLFTSLMYTVI